MSLCEGSRRLQRVQPRMVWVGERSKRVRLRKTKRPGMVGSWKTWDSKSRRRCVALSFGGRVSQINDVSEKMRLSMCSTVGLTIELPYGSKNTKNV